MSTTDDTTTIITEFKFEHLEPLFIFTSEQIATINRYNKLDWKFGRYERFIRIPYNALEHELQIFFNTTSLMGVKRHFNYLVKCLEYDREITRLNMLMDERDDLLTEIDNLFEQKDKEELIDILKKNINVSNQLIDDSQTKLKAHQLCFQEHALFILQNRIRPLKVDDVEIDEVANELAIQAGLKDFEVDESWLGFHPKPRRTSAKVKA